jgi:hypothetical protein
MLGNALAAGAWVPADCKARGRDWHEFHQAVGMKDVEKAWQNYPAAVRKAQPGTPLYTPHPYPKTDDKVIENFRYAYFNRLWEGTPIEKLPARERPIFGALKEARLRIEVLKVENWGTIRCTSHRPLPYYHLLRLFDVSTGREVARSVQFDSGLMGLYRNVSREVEEALPPLSALPALLETRFARRQAIEQPQYITTDGLPYCRQDVPCIAFRSAGNIYLLDAGELLYEIDGAAPRTSVLNHRREQMRQGLQPLGVTEFEAPVVSLGFEWTKAKLVGGQKRR